MVSSDTALPIPFSVLPMKDAINFSSPTWAAAAFQDHIARKPTGLKVCGGDKAKAQRLKWKRELTENQRLQKQLSKLVGAKGLSEIPGYSDKDHYRRLERIANQKCIDRFKANLSLAERLGLAESPPAPLTESQWQTVSETHAIRNKSLPVDCSICHESIGVDPQVLLSCTHSFHLNCLESFEKFTCKAVSTPAKFQLCCPLCRQSRYQKRIVYDNLILCRNWAATRIQACFRGYVARRAYAQYRATHKPKHPLLLKKYIANKMAALTLKLDATSKQKHTELADKFGLLKLQLGQQSAITDAILADAKLSKLSGALAQAKLTGSWKLKFDKAIKSHGQDDCPICLKPLIKLRNAATEGALNLSLLDCGHLLHSFCIAAFELYISEDSALSMLEMPSSNETLINVLQQPKVRRKCPICRAFYSRRNV